MCESSEYVKRTMHEATKECRNVNEVLKITAAALNQELGGVWRPSADVLCRINAIAEAGHKAVGRVKEREEWLRLEGVCWDACKLA